MTDSQATRGRLPSPNRRSHKAGKLIVALHGAASRHGSQATRARLFMSWHRLFKEQEQWRLELAGWPRCLHAGVQSRRTTAHHTHPHTSTAFSPALGLHHVRFASTRLDLTRITCGRGRCTAPEGVQCYAEQRARGWPAAFPSRLRSRFTSDYHHWPAPKTGRDTHKFPRAPHGSAPASTPPSPPPRPSPGGPVSVLPRVRQGCVQGKGNIDGPPGGGLVAAACWTQATDAVGGRPKPQRRRSGRRASHTRGHDTTQPPLRHAHVDIAAVSAGRTA